MTGSLFAWHDGPMVGFDTETTGVDVEHDRIVTAAIVTNTRDAQPLEWMLNPGILIPEGATAVHGITTERAVEDGMDPAAGVEDITDTLHGHLAQGTPVIVANAVYDLTLLDRECRRHGLPTLEQRLGRPIAPVVDPMVIDRRLDRWRKGSRTLTHLAEHYRVPLGDDAHGAAADALAALRITWRLAVLFPNEVQVPLVDLHARQQAWRAEWAEDFVKYLVRQGKPADDVVGTWPLKAVA
jgi:DNA polymerase-3 subunit epsilon